MLQETANSIPSVLVILFLKKLLGFVYTDTKNAKNVVKFMLVP